MSVPVPAVSWEAVEVRHRAGPVVGPATLHGRRGRVLGLVGGNGAGKTTLLKATCGLVRTYSGQVVIDGTPVQAGVMSAGVGAIIEEPRFLLGASAEQNLRLAAAARRDWLERMGQSLADVGLESWASRPVAAFSQGMRQRLGIARLLLGAPTVVVFDEPTNGLDPEGIRWIRRLIQGLAQTEHAVVLSSHLLAEVHVDACRRWRDRAPRRSGHITDVRQLCAGSK